MEIKFDIIINYIKKKEQKTGRSIVILRSMDYKETAEYCVKNLMPNLSVFVGVGLSIDAK